MIIQKLRAVNKYRILSVKNREVGYFEKIYMQFSAI